MGEVEGTRGRQPTEGGPILHSDHLSVYFTLKVGYATVDAQVTLEIAKKARRKISQGSTYMLNSKNSYNYSVNEQVWCLAPQVVVTKKVRGW